MHSACLKSPTKLFQYRFQYLELAHYLVYGKCPAQPPKDSPEGYILSARNKAFPEGYNSFLTNSAAVLNTDGFSGTSQEVVFGGRVDGSLHAHATAEYRTFTYTDGYVRISETCV